MSNPSELHLAAREDCTGCAACAAVCPRDCIRMEQDGEGFARPVIGEGCAGCRLCESVCPVLREKETLPPPEVYAVWNKNEEVRRKSTSGGFFPVLADFVLSQGGAVYGAAFDESFRLKHICVESPGELYRLQGAKYVQSDLAGVYQDVLRRLKEGRWVLFSGTPCQAEGLYRFIKEPFDKLITCDLICHGIPSPEVWKRYKDKLEETRKSTLKSVSFRDKRDGWSRARFAAVFEDGSAYSAPLTQTPYGRGFGMALFLRPSCYRCSYAAPGRHADFTLGDFWGIDKRALPTDAQPEDGVSLVLVHSVKGKALFSKLRDKFGFMERPLKEAQAGNPRLKEPIEKPKARADFFRDFETLPWAEAEGKWLKIPSLPYRVTAKVLGPGLKKMLRGMLGK